MSGKNCRARIAWVAVAGLLLGVGLSAKGLAEGVEGSVADVLIDDVARVPAERWIGVVCTPVVEALRVHLGLPEGEGLLVIHVVPGSPAAKAELKTNDILLKAGNKPLRDAEALMGAVKESGGKPIDLEVVRLGQKASVTVAPGQRPEKPETPLLPEAKPYVEWLRPWADRPDLLERIPLRLRQIAPGLLRIGRRLPEDVSVTVQKEGKQPAKITVKEGDQTWEITENEIGELPEKVRSYVSDLVGRPGSFQLDLGLFPDAEREFRRQQKRRVERVRKPEPEQGRLERRLERLEQKLEELVEAMPPRADRDEAAATDE